MSDYAAELAERCLMAGCGRNRRWHGDGADAHPDADHLFVESCRACGSPILAGNWVIADGCPCNSGRGVNHGKVPVETCTCRQCDPLQTGGSRYRLSPSVADDYAHSLAAAVFKREDDRCQLDPDVQGIIEGAIRQALAKAVAELTDVAIENCHGHPAPDVLYCDCVIDGVQAIRALGAKP